MTKKDYIWLAEHLRVQLNRIGTAYVVVGVEFEGDN